MGSCTLTIYEHIYCPKNVKAPVGHIEGFLSLFLSLLDTDAFGLEVRPISNPKASVFETQTVGWFLSLIPNSSDINRRFKMWIFCTDMPLRIRPKTESLETCSYHARSLLFSAVFIAAPDRLRN